MYIIYVLISLNSRMLCLEVSTPIVYLHLVITKFSTGYLTIIWYS